MLKSPFQIIKRESTGFVQTEQAEGERVPAGTHAGSPAWFAASLEVHIQRQEFSRCESL